jgi:hypothetical protein
MSHIAGQAPIPVGTLKQIVILDGKVKDLNPLVLIRAEVKSKFFL